MTTKGISITAKDILFIITIAGLIIGFFVKFEVMKGQVESNTQMLKDNNLELINYKLDDLDSKVDRAIELLLIEIE